MKKTVDTLILFRCDWYAQVGCPATTLDAFAQVPIMGKLSLVLRGENLTGETIVTRNQGGSIDQGATRTIWSGLRYGF